MVASCTIVLEDIKNRPNLDDDAIISDDEAVEELSDQKVPSAIIGKKGFNEMVAIGGEHCMVVCMDRSSELCKEFDYLIKKFGVYAKEITESEECKKNEEMMKKPGGQTMFG
ncbi:hypothetical protein AVEN_120890-1 [Araneus ventricosus]|uniref:Uncharacterized protein n=1 Tax=Araneus ventricosus TaxID=182803 RepID=A0A4Y2JHE8_ARAVE|nr:hypothetical protein AVEN_120890-1 [Araneus ventricosus]